MEITPEVFIVTKIILVEMYSVFDYKREREIQGVKISYGFLYSKEFLPLVYFLTVFFF